jgi:RNA polymerase primary sigma factor
MAALGSWQRRNSDIPTHDRGPRASHNGGSSRGRPPRDAPDQAEVRLVLAAQRGGAHDRSELVETFLPLIASIARGYRRSTRISRDELMQEGVVGLLRALERYEPGRGVSFWAYAAWWVRQAMQDVVSELSGPLVLSDRALRQLARIKNARRRFEQTRGRSPSVRELAAAARLPQAHVESLMRTELRVRSLDEPANGETSDARNVGDLVSDPTAEDAFSPAPYRAFAPELPRLLARLTERERTVICARYGIGHQEQTLREVAGHLGVTAERVRQIEHTSLTKLCAAVDQA